MSKLSTAVFTASFILLSSNIFAEDLKFLDGIYCASAAGDVTIKPISEFQASQVAQKNYQDAVEDAAHLQQLFAQTTREIKYLEDDLNSIKRRIQESEQLIANLIPGQMQDDEKNKLQLLNTEMSRLTLRLIQVRKQQDILTTSLAPHLEKINILKEQLQVANEKAQEFVDTNTINGTLMATLEATVTTGKDSEQKVTTTSVNCLLDEEQALTCKFGGDSQKLNRFVLDDISNWTETSPSALLDFLGAISGHGGAKSYSVAGKIVKDNLVFDRSYEIKCSNTFKRISL